MIKVILFASPDFSVATDIIKAERMKNKGSFPKKAKVFFAGITDNAGIKKRTSKLVIAGGIKFVDHKIAVNIKITVILYPSIVMPSGFIVNAKRNNVNNKSNRKNL
jgi:hypothetical protein